MIIHYRQCIHSSEGSAIELEKLYRKCIFNCIFYAVHALSVRQCNHTKAVI